MHTEVVECDHEHEITLKSDHPPEPHGSGNGHSHSGHNTETSPLLSREVRCSENLGLGQY